MPSCLSLFGDSGAAYCEAEHKICTFECASEKAVPVFYTLPLETGYRVTYMLNFGVKDKQQMVLVRLSGGQTDKLLLLKLLNESEPTLTKVAEYEMQSKIQVIALGAGLHHSGHADPANESQNSAYVLASSSGNQLSMMDRMNFGMGTQSPAATSEEVSFVV